MFAQKDQRTLGKPTPTPSIALTKRPLPRLHQAPSNIAVRIPNIEHTLVKLFNISLDNGMNMASLGKEMWDNYAMSTN